LPKHGISQMIISITCSKLPLSDVAHEEMVSLQEEMQDISTNWDHDKCKLPWGDYFSIKKVYIALIGEQDTNNQSKTYGNHASSQGRDFFFMAASSRKTKFQRPHEEK
jgi:hypothetical protein